MQEIRILELLILFLLLLPVLRPFLKDLQPLDGLVWFPPLALGCLLGLFPVYGFRPEALPLLVLGVLLNIRNFSALISRIKRLRHDNFQYLVLGNRLITVFLLIITGVIALYFAPLTDTALIVEGVRGIRVRDEARNMDLFLRIYGSGEPVYQGGAKTRPVMILLPPVIGSVPEVDKLCGALGTQGFTVITYSRWNGDPSRAKAGKERYGSPLGEQFRFLRACLWGRSFEGSNTLGRTLEEDRKQDILFLLSSIKKDIDLGPLEGATDRDRIFLAGYGPGGSAITLLGESPELRTLSPEVKGLIAVESPLWSTYGVEQRYPPEPPDEAVLWFKSLWSSITTGFINLFPKKISGIEGVPYPELPLLFIVSDRVMDPPLREQGYKPMIRLLQGAVNAALIAVEGAGILAYSDYPAKYPLYTAFFSGNKRKAWRNEDFIGGTASLMTHFAALVLAGLPQDPAAPPVLVTPPRGILEAVYFETSRVWNLPHLGYILPP